MVIYENLSSWSDCSHYDGKEKGRFAVHSIFFAVKNKLKWSLSFGDTLYSFVLLNTLYCPNN